ncbi:uncharacterized protein C8A04DRAFT_35941 [Dichotomopilus funicola]|uniref:F-box domain-containing protein n=1 Tax=Dichotomopilus funicola TaxID=1934379 RepID=A0AAN6ZMX0_9PEZI|nr:hypothetical protein C8A04DRAFT_35941 [Dichotomopilus funicola]
MPHQLADLPDDVLFLIFASLDCARDFRAVGLSCRRLQHLVENDGWRIFVRNSFPSLLVPSPATGNHTWRHLAESLTWQSRCWDRRAIQFQALLPRREHQRQDRGHGRAIGSFMAVVDATFDPTSQRELVVWGGGEDVVARYRERRGHGQVSKTSWHRLKGNEFGLRNGYDDVKALKVVKHGGKQAIITGRYSGELSLISAEPDDFGKQIAHFGPLTDQNITFQQLAASDAINSLDVFNGSNGPRVAAAAKTTLRMYDIPQESAAEIPPIETYDLKEGGALTSGQTRLGCAKWMENGDSLALALVGAKNPLRYLTRTPTGWSLSAAAKNERVEKEFNAKFQRNVALSALEPVNLHSGAKGGTSLLLSSWRDGTIRLQDLRTPSAFDTIYQNNVDPWLTADSLMAYGTERFITGGGSQLAIQIFDFRWSKSYYHTTGLPCRNVEPFPRPHQPFMKPPFLTPTTNRSRCNHVRGLPCHWHNLSQDIYYRPNSRMFVSGSLRPHAGPGGIWSLARPSDVSPHFYMGVSDGVIEACLEQTSENSHLAWATNDTNFGVSDWHTAPDPETGYRVRKLVPALMETGDGYSYANNDRSILLPGLNKYHGPKERRVDLGAWASHHRLDQGYQLPGDAEKEKFGAIR